MVLYETPKRLCPALFSLLVLAHALTPLQEAQLHLNNLTPEINLDDVLHTQHFVSGSQDTWDIAFFSTYY